MEPLTRFTALRAGSILVYIITIAWEWLVIALFAVFPPFEQADCPTGIMLDCCLVRISIEKGEKLKNQNPPKRRKLGVPPRGYCIYG